MRPIIATSLEFVRLHIAATDSGNPTDPTLDLVTIAFVRSMQPASGDFVAASWETDASTPITRYYARCLVGPGGAIELAPGTYQVFVKIVADPELPILHAGLLRVV